VTPEDAEEWTQALAQVGAGWWRQVALAVRQGAPAALGLSLDRWREERLGGLVLKSIPERQRAVAELTEDGFTKAEIAAVVGVDERTVQRDRNPRETDVSPSPAPGGTDPLDGETDVFLGGDEIEPPAREHRICVGPAGAECAECGRRIPMPTNEGDEWYTPRWLFDAFGIKFSIDVCAPVDQTHSSVPAARHFTAEDDGLAQPWEGTVWCNPPYSKPEPWARRMIHHRDGLLLTHIPMNAGWCVDMWEACDGIRLFQAMEFVRPDGSSQRPGYWLQLAAFGPVAIEALARLQPLGDAAANKRRIASPMWRQSA
jgi:DNA N-6-adenine-methyltransferase (Dam)